MNQYPVDQCRAAPGGKPAKVCPLSQVPRGTVVCIKELATTPELACRLRELGLRERSEIRLISGEANLICQLCGARFGISEKLAASILVEAV